MSKDPLRILRRSRQVVAGVVLVGVLLSGCTSSSSGGGTTSDPNGGDTAPSVTGTPSVATIPNSSASPTPSVIDVPTPTAETTSSLDPEAQEIADRAAVEAQWVKFWEIYNGIVRTPRDQREAELDSVAINPVVERILGSASEADAQGIDNYGTVTHHISWQFPVGGKRVAVLADCQDQSQGGTLVVSSGEILTTGAAKSNMRGEFVRDDEGTWRLRELYFIQDEAC